MILDIVFNTGEQYYSSPQGIDWKAVWQFAQVVVTIIAIRIAFVQWRLAHRAAENRDVRKTFTLKQMETVFALSNSIQSTLLVMSMKENRDQTYFAHKWINLSEVSNELRKESLLDIKTLDSPQFVVSTEVTHRLEFYKFASDPFLPSEIAVEIQKFISMDLEPRHPPLDFDSEFTFLTLASRIDKEVEDFNIVYLIIRTNPVFKNLETFLLQVKVVKEKIFNWLNQYGVEPNGKI